MRQLPCELDVPGDREAGCEDLGCSNRNRCAPWGGSDFPSPATQGALQVVQPGGMVSVMCYTGHDGKLLCRL